MFVDCIRFWWIWILFFSSLVVNFSFYFLMVAFSGGPALSWTRNFDPLETSDPQFMYWCIMDTFVWDSSFKCTVQNNTKNWISKSLTPPILVPIKVFGALSTASSFHHFSRYPRIEGLLETFRHRVTKLTIRRGSKTPSGIKIVHLTSKFLMVWMLFSYTHAYYCTCRKLSYSRYLFPYSL